MSSSTQRNMVSAPAPACMKCEHWRRRRGGRQQDPHQVSLAALTASRGGEIELTEGHGPVKAIEVNYDPLVELGALGDCRNVPGHSNPGERGIYQGAAGRNEAGRNPADRLARIWAASVLHASGRILHAAPYEDGLNKVNLLAARRWV